MPLINIKYKCPKGEDSRATTVECSTHKHFRAFLSNVYSDSKEADYRVCKHTRDRVSIITLKYGGKELTIADDTSAKLTNIHPNIKEVSTYYHKYYDSDNKEINKPLVLKLKEYGGKVHWYSNADARDEKGEQDGGTTWEPNTKWNAIDGNKFYDRDLKGDVLKRQLDELTCKLHNLHYIDISRNEKPDPYYSCPVCKKYSVRVSKDDTIGEYTKYKHTYTADANSVRYNDTLLKWRYEEGDVDYDETFPLESDKIPYLTVYYWEKDKEHTKPLILEVGLGYASLYYVNDRNVNDRNVNNNDNSRWSRITGKDGGLQLEDDELKKALQELKYNLFKPVIIDASKKDSYNQYCIKEGCTNASCPNEVKVENYDGSIYGFKNCIGWRHTYGKDNKTFTITNFTGGPSEGKDLIEFPIWDVTKVVVFFPGCSTKKTVSETPLVVYLENGNGNINRWSRNTDPNGANKWEDISCQFNKSPSGVPDLVTTLNDITKELKLNCPVEEKQELNQARSPMGTASAVREDSVVEPVEVFLEPEVVSVGGPGRGGEAKEGEPGKPKETKEDHDERSLVQNIPGTKTVGAIPGITAPAGPKVEGPQGPRGHEEATEDITQTDREVKEVDPGSTSEEVTDSEVATGAGKGESGIGGSGRENSQDISTGSGYPGGLFDWGSLASTLGDFAEKAVSPLIELKSALAGAVSIGATKAAYNLVNVLAKAGEPPKSPSGSQGSGGGDKAAKKDQESKVTKNEEVNTATDPELVPLYIPESKAYSETKETHARDAKRPGPHVSSEANVGQSGHNAGGGETASEQIINKGIDDQTRQAEESKDGPPKHDKEEKEEFKTAKATPPEGVQAQHPAADRSGPSDSTTPPTEPPQEKAEQLVDGASGLTITAILTGMGTYGGPLAGAGATFFGGWKLYNRYKGDPWVRQI
ncbi:hypothetical protein BEWA_016800 [Theileria equi strain WA]|uniref:Uncharacterized protein n=1 Tax=Theileria equi strain WA TaxID=1537102 RepID=L1L9B4_THEEQ|nr:hypothetical protein BEWA_016800 [Theileria equi strain WA]EKX72002.1 hypothetical protein BEWA_016800 [Theileria equi strain WA]|eukprot:XP_004831454.1 hypothetical protein BEWA_016800 [Theileria equi strain WA]